jgi:hypothetical protein
LALLTINKIFVALGNNRPQILVLLEDYVLQAIIGISEGRLHEDALDTLYSQILSLENELSSDDEAMNWFNLSTAAIPATSTPPPSEFHSTPLARK